MEKRRITARVIVTGLFMLPACAPGGESEESQGPHGKAPRIGSPETYRLSTLALRDPHVSYVFGGCRDITDQPIFGQAVNPAITAGLTTDSSPLDGFLDLSLLLHFPVYDPSAPGDMTLLGGDCRNTSTCAPSRIAPPVTVPVSSECTGVVPGTTSGYTPAVVSPTGDCFTARAPLFPVNFGAVNISLRDVAISAAFKEGELVGGLMRGFLSRADADATGAIETPIGTILITEVLPGGQGSCATGNDMDVTSGGTDGWYFYLNFTATALADPVLP